MTTSTSTTAPGPLAARLIAAMVLGIETLALVIAGSAYVVYGMALSGSDATAGSAGSAAADGAASGDQGFAFAIAAFALGSAIALAFAAWGVFHARRWAVSLAITWQVLQAAVGAYAVTLQPVAGAVVIGLALLGGAAAMRSTRVVEVPADAPGDAAEHRSESVTD